MGGTDGCGLTALHKSRQVCIGIAKNIHPGTGGLYIDSIELHDFRSFRQASITFAHPDQDFAKLDVPRPKLRNINLLLGNNGQGKSSLLRAVALACLGPAVGDSGIFPHRFVRREPGAKSLVHRKQAAGSKADTAAISAEFTVHKQDIQSGGKLHASVEVQRKGDLEVLASTASEDPRWEPIFEARSDAFFFVGYGATRRVESKEHFDAASRRRVSFARAQRVQGLFEDAYSLVPLNGWLPGFQAKNKGRYVQVVNLINKLVGAGHFRFTGALEEGEYVYERGGLKVPFPALSDGYRAYLGWAGDLLYHVCMTCPAGRKLVENRGIVMIDEVDLHLHPQWQMKVLPTLARALPQIQFIVTSHSPLIVGSLEWPNIIAMKSAPRQATTLVAFPRQYTGSMPTKCC